MAQEQGWEVVLNSPNPDADSHLKGALGVAGSIVGSFLRRGTDGEGNLWLLRKSCLVTLHLVVRVQIWVGWWKVNVP